MIFAGITLYNPDKERLTANISAIVSQVESIILVDNGSQNIREIRQMIETQFGKAQFKWIENGKNLGVATALNQIFKYAVEKHAQWVLALDQDSVCPPDLIEEYRSYMDDSEVAIISPKIVDRNFGVSKERKQSDMNRAFDEIEQCITSASLNRVADWIAVGGFFEELFIDYVDHDYCARIRLNNRKIIRVNGTVVLHELGNGGTHRIFGRTVHNLNHPAFRKYYMVRNGLFYVRKYQKLLDCREEKKKIRNLYIKTFLYEDHKLEKLRAMNRGRRDSKKLGGINV